MATITLNNGLELTDEAQEFLKEIQDDIAHYLEELIVVNDFIIFHESENPSEMFDGMGLLFFLQQLRDVIKRMEKPV